MATHYKDHRIIVFTKITAVYSGNLKKHINTSWTKFRYFKIKTSGTARIETTSF
jgi:hypothetical protein